MRIPQKLPQFVKKHALIIVTGRQSAKVFHVRNHGIVELEEFKIERPKYSDNEGFSTHGPRGAPGSVSGSTREIRAQEIIVPFLKQLRTDVQKILQTHRITDIYVFAPSYLARKVLGSLSENAQRLVRGEIRGNYTHEQPLKLLEIVSASHV